MFKIEKGVKPPESRSRYPLAKMDVGDSFLAPKKIQSKITAAANYQKRRHKKTFTVRKISDKNVRCWRVA